jgi:hypothetical protein
MRTMAEWLESDETGEPFRHCIHCKMPLVETASPWLVSKEITGDECLLEYAVCLPCRDRLMNQLEETSKAAVRYFIRHRIDWDARLAEFMLSHEPTDRFEACIACCQPRANLTSYAISALYDSRGVLVQGPLPLLLCQPCLAKMTAGLSASDHAVWQRFLGENFPSPPDGSGFSGMV